MNALTSSLSLHTLYSSGLNLKPADQIRLNICPRNRSLSSTNQKKPKLKVQASGDRGRLSSAGIFVGGFVLGGIVVGTLGCVYAPQISKALAGADRKDLMRRLPKFIYDEEKALERTRKILAEKIAQLNSAIDDVSSQLHADDESPNGVAAVNFDEIESTI